MTLSERSVNKPTTVLMIYILLFALGIYAVFNLPIDRFPDMELPYVAIITTYKNAGPEEVEQSITRTLESSLSGVTGLKKMNSQSSTGTSTIYMEMNYGINLDEAVSGCRDKIDIVRKYLPSDADSPIIFRMDPAMMPIMGLAIKGNHSPEELRKIDPASPIKPHTVATWAKQGLIYSVKIGNRRLVSMDSLESYLSGTVADIPTDDAATHEPPRGTIRPIIVK